MPHTRPAVATAFRRTVTSGEAPLVTYAVAVLCILVFIAEVATGLLSNGGGGAVYQQLAFAPRLVEVQPWRIVTTLFTHQSLLHIAFNLFSLFILGRQLEPMIGRIRFISLFLLSGVGGSVAVILLQPNSIVVGASGAIFGLFGAYFIIARHLGANATQIIIVIAINLGIGFIVPGIAWQAHVGGLIVGALVGLVYVRTRSRSQRMTQVLLVSAIAVGVVALATIGTLILTIRP